MRAQTEKIQELLTFVFFYEDILSRCCMYVSTYIYVDLIREIASK